jgi:hypothetical protein
MKYILLILISVLAIALMAACGTKTITQIVEVTRIVQEPKEQVVVTVEVTQLVEVNKVVEKEVTRKVSVEPTPPPTPAYGKLNTYGIGDVVQMDYANITLNSAEVANGILKANFTIENKGTSSYSLTPALNLPQQTASLQG